MPNSRSSSDKKLVIGCMVVLVIVVVVWVFSSISKEGFSLYQKAYDSDKLSPPSHPVLRYQLESSYGTVPASYGDPIRVDERGYGPAVGEPMNVPVKRNTLKEASERYKRPFYSINYDTDPFRQAVFPPIGRGGLDSLDYFRPYGPNVGVNAASTDTPFYESHSGFLSPYLQRNGTPRFYGSSNAFAPFPEVNTPWEKIGIVSPEGKSSGEYILNLYRRPIAPLQDLFEYTVQDKNGFVIPLERVTYLESGDTIRYIPGYESVGPWRVRIFVNNKYIWV